MCTEHNFIAIPLAAHKKARNPTVELCMRVAATNTCQRKNLLFFHAILEGVRVRQITQNVIVLCDYSESEWAVMAFAAARMILKDKRRKTSSREELPCRNRSKVKRSVASRVLVTQFGFVLWAFSCNISWFNLRANLMHFDPSCDAITFNKEICLFAGACRQRQ